MMKRIKLISTAVALLCGAGLPAQDYKNSALSPQERADDLLGRLSVEQKISLMMHDSPEIRELGIKKYNWWNEALHGCARAGLATVFPQAIGMAASWDETLLQECFDIAGTEQRIKYVQYRNGMAELSSWCAERGERQSASDWYHGLTVWTPNINIFRDPRWGRGQETYGEDPYFTYRMGKAVVNGLQSQPRDGYDKLHACLKHFAVHSGPEPKRHNFNITDLSLRDLKETYLYAFRNIIAETDVQQVMCAYNAFEGSPCCGSDKLLTRILREDWGYRGLVVSDCCAVDDFYKDYGHKTYPGDAPASAAAAVRAGTDLECGWSYNSLREAYAKGQVSVNDLDKSLRRLLIARFRLGEMDELEKVVWNSVPQEKLACEEHRLKALKMAGESMVLLQNDGILPLKKGVRIAVTGPNAADTIAVLGNYNGTPRHAVSALEGIQNAFGAVNVTTDPALADIIIYVGGITPQLEGEAGEYDYNAEGFLGGDRTTIELPRAQRQEIAALAQAGKKIILVNYSGSCIALKPEQQRCSAILQAWYGGECAGLAIAGILCGEINPSGKLPVTFYGSDADLPDFENYDMEGRTYRYFRGKPLWSFGHGLSYTQFQYGKAVWHDGTLFIDVRNIGGVDGDEVVQVYVKKKGEKDGPVRSLRGFRRVHIKAGDSVRVEIPLGEKELAMFDEMKGDIVFSPGKYNISYGGSSACENLKNIVIFAGCNKINSK